MESTLSVTYEDLQSQIGRFLGYPDDAGTWSAGQIAHVDRHIQSGYKQFLYPPAVEGIESGYEWSFIRPVATIDTVSGDKDQDLPEDFGRVAGDFHYESGIHSLSVVLVSEHRIEMLHQHDDDEGKPQFAATRFKSSDGSDGQRQEIVWWPTPDAVYTLTYRYEVFVDKLETGDYPLGGMKHSELITESCLAIAEQRENDEAGIHTQNFMRLLASSIAQDRKNGAKFFGAMGLGETVEGDKRRVRLTGDITYKGSTW